ncbi:MAG TPA: hypothetical protein DDW30_07060 [Clostridiales bacterium]|nr:hypothetical protein [Clostridiales bacterium]
MKRILQQKRWLALAILAILVALALVACNTGGGKPSGTTGGGTPAASGTAGGDSTATEAPAQDGDGLRLVEGNKSVRVVIPWNAADAEREAAGTVAKMLEKKSGQTVTATAEGETHDADAVEILVGATAYEETERVTGRLAFGAWTLTVEGKKVVLYATLEKDYNIATQTLVSLIFGQKDGDVRIAEDYSKVGFENDLLRALPRLGNRLPDSYMFTGVGETCVGLTYNRQSAEDLAAFCKTVEENGYTEYATNQIGENRFATYRNADYVLNLMYVPVRERITVTAERLTTTALPAKAEENTYQKNVCETTVTQLGLWIGYSETDRWDRWINGLSHVIRLEDGSFIIIDGGHQREMNDRLLYETLKKQAPDPNNIRVAAWIFTHGHGDHTGTFLAFQHEDVTVEQFIYHFPSNAEAAKANYGNGKATEDRVRALYPEAKVVTAHPGQVFTIRNARIEMYWSLDLYYPNAFTFYNESSLVFTVELNGHKIMYLGDLGPLSNQSLVGMYGSALESEAVQTAHHGFEGGSLDLYKKIAAKYVYCDSGSRDLFDRSIKDKNGNDYYYGKDDITTWFAADTVIVVTYKAGEEPSAVTYENSAAYFAAE